MSSFPDARGPRFCCRGAEPPARIPRHVHEPLCRYWRVARARRHRRRRSAAAADPRLAADLVRVAAADAGAGARLPGHRDRSSAAWVSPTSPTTDTTLRRSRATQLASWTHWATTDSRCTEPTRACPLRTRWPRTFRTGSIASRSRNRSCPACRSRRRCSCRRSPTPASGTSCSTSSQVTSTKRSSAGREHVFFGAEFDASAGTRKLPDEVVVVLRRPAP